MIIPVRLFMTTSVASPPNPRTESTLNLPQSSRRPVPRHAPFMATLHLRLGGGFEEYSMSFSAITWKHDSVG